MPSLSDIPPELLESGKQLDFIFWLVRVPTPYYTRRELVFLWQSATKSSITSQAWDFIRRNSGGVNELEK